jgi:ATP-dependent Clp protease ATP-binding subunit ClpC
MEPWESSLTAQARQVLSYATEEARAFNHDYIGSEHLLLGLLREHTGVAARALTDLGVTPIAVRSIVDDMFGHDEGLPQDISIPASLSGRARQIIEHAVSARLQQNRDPLDTEHLLLGLIEDYEGAAVAILNTLNVSEDQVRDQVKYVLVRQSSIEG